jgi:hypothetical protein
MRPMARNSSMPMRPMERIQTKNKARHPRSGVNILTLIE